MRIQRNILILGICSTFLLACQKELTVERESQKELYNLLQTWCDGLLEYQLQYEPNALNGGVVCPACALAHGRTPDAVYPLLFMGEHTGDKKYIDAAFRLFYWGKNNVRFPDGSWSNEVNLSDWRGTTVFTLIALAEAFRDFSYMMDLKTKNDWYACVSEQADFVTHYIRPGVGSINYSMSACYALVLAAEITKNDTYKRKAAELATIIPDYVTSNDFFVYGEGEYPYVKSFKGIFPVDLGYNVEETLPNLLLYAEMVQDKSLKELIKRSMRTHIEFMLPDGAWDNSWGTRNFKWTYWGSRTSDGVLPLCAILAKEDSIYSEVGYRNFELLRRCTANKLLYGGCHYVSAGYPACIHHTFEHAKSLAVALKLGFEKPQSRIPLPRDKEYGIRHFKDVDVWNVSYKGWKATVCGCDADYKMTGGNPHGGTLTLLWNDKTGPLFASGMMSYWCVEPANMQMNRTLLNYPCNLEVCYEEKGKKYRTLAFRNADISSDELEGKKSIKVRTSLETEDYQLPEIGRVNLEIVYEFAENKISIRVDVLPPHENIDLKLYIPLISQTGEEYGCEDVNEYWVLKGGKSLQILSDKEIMVLPLPLGKERGFSPTPGFEFIPFNVLFKNSVKLSLVLT